MKQIIITLAIIVFSISVKSQPTPSKGYLRNAHKIVEKIIIPQIMIKDTLLKGITKRQLENITIQIYPRYWLTADVRNFKKGDDLLKYLIITDDFLVRISDRNNVFKPFFRCIYSDSLHDWIFINCYSSSLDNIYSLSPKFIFNVFGLSYNFFKINDTIKLYSPENSKKIISLEEYENSDRAVFEVCTDGYDIAFNQKLITKEQLDSIDDKLLNEWGIAQRKLNNLKNKAINKN
jgi:hypothetical protein